jgi:MFS transporter, DHA2 family, methylenomycin A resistance protein
VVSAVSRKQAGLASGTIGMARNIGTAFGVAVMSQVYLLRVNTALPSSLAASRTAADQFLAQGTSRLLVEGAILQGFKLTALACFILCGGAAILALFIRPRLREKAAVDSAQTAERSMSLSTEG